MNLYADVEALKGEVKVAVSTRDAEIEGILDAVSRYIDGRCRRVFYTETGVRYFDGPRGDALLVDDLLVLSAMDADSGHDGSYAQTWTSADYALFPSNGWPKTMVQATPWGDHAFRPGVRRYRLSGTWGYGTGNTHHPWTALGVTVTVADATTTTLTVSAEGSIRRGMTILAGSEQMYVSAASATGAKTLTVMRGVNGTTAAAHTATAAYGAQYPALITRTALILGAEMWAQRGAAGFSQERIGSYQYVLSTAAQQKERDLRLLGGFIR